MREQRCGRTCAWLQGQLAPDLPLGHVPQQGAAVVPAGQQLRGVAGVPGHRQDALSAKPGLSHHHDSRFICQAGTRLLGSKATDRMRCQQSLVIHITTIPCSSARQACGCWGSRPPKGRPAALAGFQQRQMRGYGVARPCHQWSVMGGGMIEVTSGCPGSHWVLLRALLTRDNGGQRSGHCCTGLVTVAL